MKKKMIYLVIVAMVVIFALSFLAFTGFFAHTDVSGTYDNFAKCLTEKGAIMYGSRYCSHCANQKSMFGSSFKYITYIECADSPDMCNNAGVSAVPAWNVGGKLYTGEQSLQNLAELSGCTLA